MPAVYLKPLVVTLVCALVVGFGAVAQEISPATAVTDRADFAEKAFEGAQWVMATKAARAVAQTGARTAAGDGPLAVLIRERQDIEAQLDRLRDALANPDQAVRAQSQSAAQKLDVRLLDLDAEIQKAFPDYAEFAYPKPVGFAALQQHLRPDEGLVLFLTTAQATYVWAVGKTQHAWHRVPIGVDVLSDRIRHLRADLDPTSPARAATPLSAPSPPAGQTFDRLAAHALYVELLGPVIDTLADAEHLFVVKDGPLSSLPLSILLTTLPEPSAPFAEADWLLNRFALTTLPGVSSLVSLRRSGAQASKRPRPPQFVGFGDPDFGGGRAGGDQITSRAINSFFDDSGTRLDAIRRLAPLPGTARELRRIAGLFAPEQSVIKLGLAATETAVKTADLRDASIISFATHGLITGDISGLAEPALVLSPPDTATPLDDGLLTASEAAQLDLNADWVILSACNTAAGDGTPGAQGLSGLARSFLFAGADTILVSHWPVRDDVAARLTSDTLQRLRDAPELGRADALRHSVLTMIQDTRDPSLAHPSAWAPFVLVGDGGAALIP